MSSKFLRHRFPRYGTIQSTSTGRVVVPPVTTTKPKNTPPIINQSIVQVKEKPVVVTSDINLKRFQVARNSWYKLHIMLGTKTEYKRGLLKIFGETENSSIFPPVKLPNTVFANVDKFNSIDDLDELTTFDIYFKTGNHIVAQIHMLNLTTIMVKVEKVDEQLVKKKVNIWRLRRLYDLEFLNYYLKNLYTDFNNQHFLDRFGGEYRLYKDQDCFDKYISKLRVNVDDPDKGKGVRVLYLTHSSIQYEETDDTVRTQMLAEYAHGGDTTVYVATRLGFPDDREPEIAKKQVRSREHGGITYYRLGSQTESKSTSVVDYLQNYILETIKLADQLGVHIIHATSNYWNGIAAVYAAKYLKIKSVYEVRCFWEDSTIDYKPELFNSDLLNMRSNMETLVMEKVDLLICSSNSLKEDILERGIDESKIELIPDGLDGKIFSPNEDLALNTKKELDLDRCDAVIGFFGLPDEKFDQLVSCLKAINKEYNSDIKLLLLQKQDNYNIEQFRKKVESSNLTGNFVYIQNSDLKHYASIDLAVFTEGSVTELFKVLAFEKAVISSEEFAQNGILNNSNCQTYSNTSQLTETLLRIVNDVDFRFTLGRNSRKFILQRVDWRVFGNKLRELYGSLI